MDRSDEVGDNKMSKPAKSKSTTCPTKLVDGTICGQKLSKNAKFCAKHITPHPQKITKKKGTVKTIPSKIYLNTECPICLGQFTPAEQSSLHVATCEHAMHQVCMDGLVKKECPICRREITNLPTDLKTKIDANATAYRQERDEEEQHEIMNAIMQQMSHSMRPTPNVEIIMALKYLEELGVPHSMIPQHVRIRVDPRFPMPPPGAIFRGLIGKAIEMLHLEPEDFEDDIGDNEPHFEIRIMDREISDDEEFELEGDEVDLLRSAQTEPIASPASIAAARTRPQLFTTLQFSLADIPHIN